MSSEQKTSTLGLSKYQGDEHLLREDFNSDLEKIDTAISEMTTPIETTINDKTISFNTTSNLKKVTLKITADVTGGPILVSRNGQAAKPLMRINQPVSEIYSFDSYLTVIETQNEYIMVNLSSKLAIEHFENTGIHRNISFGISDPSGGKDGDIYFQYE